MSARLRRPPAIRAGVRLRRKPLQEIKISARRGICPPDYTAGPPLAETPVKKLKLLPGRGLEPLPPYGDMALNHARLPIPPSRLFGLWLMANSK